MSERMTKEERDKIAYRISTFGDDLCTEDAIALVRGFDAEREKVEKLEVKFSEKYWDEVGVEMMQLKAENQRLKDENKFLRGEFTFEEWVELQKQTAGER